MSKPKVKLFSDGSCPRNPGIGGWAYILRLESGTEIRKSGSELQTTNNRMEMMGVIEALRALPRPCEVVLCSDSEYVTKGLSEWMPKWKKKNWINSEKGPVKNSDLWKELDRLANIHEVSVAWTRGHSGHIENEIVDLESRNAAHKYMREQGIII